jgi:hypothetical protein
MVPKNVFEIPKEFDVEIYTNNFSRKDKRYGVIDAIHFILDYINNDGIKRGNIENGTPINIELLRKNVGKRSADDAMSILIENKIIDKTKDYSQIFKKSRHYKLSNVFPYGKTKKVKPLGKLSLNSNSPEDIKTAKEIEYTDNKYAHLTKFLNDGFLSFDTEKSEKLLYELVKRISEKIPNIETTYTGKKRKSYIDKCKIAYLFKCINMLQYILNIKENKKINYSVTPSNQRLNSTLTNLSKYLKQFLTYKENPLVQLDLSSSQPLLLCHFLMSKTWKKEKKIKEKHDAYNEYNNNIEDKHTTKENITHMLDTLNDIDDHELDYELGRFKKLFNGDFYENIISEVIKYNSTLEDASGFENRRNCKKTMMFLLYGNFNTPKNSKIKQYIMFKRTFPIITQILDIFKKNQKNSVALILQNLESDLFLNKITKYISEANPNIPMFTIHDAILTTPKHVEFVNKVMTTTITSITGVVPKISISESNALLNDNDFDEISEHFINEIKSKVSSQKYKTDLNKISDEKLQRFIKKHDFDTLIKNMISELNIDPSGLFSKIKFMEFNDLIDINKPNKSTNKDKSIFDFQINSNIIIETK